MKSSTLPQKNQILFCAPIKLIQPNARSTYSKIQRILYIDLNGGKLFKRPSRASTKPISSSSKDKQLNSLQNFEDPLSSFPILPEHEVYRMRQKDTTIKIYLEKVGVSLEKDQVVCQFCNSRELVMMPIFFQQKNAAFQFHQAVLTFQIYHRYFPGFQKACKDNNVTIGMNMRLISRMAHAMASKDFIIDPEDFSVVKLEDFELELVKDCIERAVNRQQKTISRSSINSSRSGVTIAASPFSLRLRYKIVDGASLNYLRSIVSEQTLRRSMRQFDVTNSSINDGILSMILMNQEVKSMKNSAMYASLVVLNLSKNQLSDLCFISLGTLVAVTPLLRDLNLSENLIKLQPLSSKTQKTSRMSRLSASPFRLSQFRLSNQLTPSTLLKSEPFFIQFLQSLQHQPLNYINLDSNLVSEPDVLVNYIIEGLNVPVRYLSVRNNKFSEVDKIRMAKLIVSEVKDRKEEDGGLGFIDFGQISVVDDEVYRYVVLMKSKFQQLGIGGQKQKQDLFQLNRSSSRQISRLDSSQLKRIQQNQPSTYKVSLTRNKQWQLCDQEGILDISNLYKARRKTEMRRSQMLNNILMGNTLSASNSQKSLQAQNKSGQKQQVTVQTFKPTVSLLRQAYINRNYSGIRLYKQLLQEYNMEVYTKKIIPLLFEYQKNHKKQQQKLLKTLTQFINFSYNTNMDMDMDMDMDKDKRTQNRNVNVNKQKQKSKTYLHQKQYQHRIHSLQQFQHANDKLDAFISILLLRRIDFQVKRHLVLYQGYDDEEDWDGHYANSVLTFLIYLRIKRDEYIQKLIQNKVNPLQQMYTKIRQYPDMYTQYYQSHKQELCEENYLETLRSCIHKSTQTGSLPSEQLVAGQKTSQKQLNECIKATYLYKCQCIGQLSTYNFHITTQDIYLCYVEPKLLWTGYLIKFYCKRFVPKVGSVTGLLVNVKGKLVVSVVKKGKVVGDGVKNILEFVSRFNLLSGNNPFLNPTYSMQTLTTTQELKLAVYNPAFQSELQKFSQLTIALIKFLHHSAQKMLAETLQYINYIINIILQEQDSYNIECMSNQFYLQLFTFNTQLSIDRRMKQIEPKILATLVQLVSLYFGCSQMLEEYVMGHLLAVGVGLDGRIARVVVGSSRYNRKEDQLPNQVVAQLFNHPNGLYLPLTLHYWDITNLPQPTPRQSQSEPDQNELEQVRTQIPMNKLELKVHLLTSIQELQNQIRKSGVIEKIILNDGENHEDGNYSQQFCKNCNWGLHVYDVDTGKISLLMPSSRQQLNVYSLYRDKILTTAQKPSNKHLLLRPLLLPLTSLHLLLRSEAQTRWWFEQIHHAFRQYGSYLSLITTTDHEIDTGTRKKIHVTDVIIDCILCSMFLNDKHKIQELVSFDQEEWKISVAYFCEDYRDNLGLYAPKGMASTLTSDQIYYITSQIKSRMQSSIEQLRKVQTYSSAILQQNLSNFEQKCVLITHPTSIINPISQQQILFTLHGVMVITRIIYAEAVFWTNVVDIRLCWDQNMTMTKAIQILYCGSVPKDGKQDLRVIKIMGGGTNEERIFVNACLLMFKNIGLTVANSDRESLYRNLYGRGKQKQQESQIKRSKNNLVSDVGQRYTLYEELQSRIQYLAAPIKRPIGLQPNKIESADFILAKGQEQQKKIWRNEQKQDGKRQDMQQKQNEQKQNQVGGVGGGVGDVDENVELIKQQSQKLELDLNKIVEKVEENSKKQENDQESVVITNARRSSRRELPKRRSSRDK